MTQGLLDIALLMANAAQLKQLVEIGPSYQYYTLLMVLVSLSIALQVSTESRAVSIRSAEADATVDRRTYDTFCFLSCTN
jgi:hypothetical protein